eukprot:11373538-Prorocentrum_lima.AAC.1
MGFQIAGMLAMSKDIMQSHSWFGRAYLGAKRGRPRNTDKGPRRKRVCAWNAFVGSRIPMTSRDDIRSGSFF